MDNKTLENRLEELKQLFGNYDYQIQQVEDEFSQTVEKLRTEALNKREQLIQQREQVRGAYTELYVLLHPEEKQRLQQSNEPEQESVQLNNITAEDVKSEEPQTQEEQVVELHNPESILTEEQVEQIQQVMEKQKERVHDAEPIVDDKKEDKKEEIVPSNTTKITPQPKQEDIPEYLTEEYNKMK